MKSLGADLEVVVEEAADEGLVAAGLEDGPRRPDITAESKTWPLVSSCNFLNQISRNFSLRNRTKLYIFVMV